MTSIALRGLAARKLRAALTALAVVLGVGLIAGTYILTDTINESFDKVFAQATKGVDVAVVPRQAVEQDGADAPGFPASYLDRVRGVEGVEKAEGSIFSQATVYGKDGDPVGGFGGFGFVASSREPPFEGFTYVEGGPPRAPDQVALDRKTAEDAGYRIGDRVRVAGDGPARSYRLVGIARFGDVNSIGGASVAIMTLPQAQRVVGKVGEYDAIDVQTADGVPAEQVVRAIRDVLPPTVTVRTGEQEAQAQAADVREGFSFLTTILLVFAGVALFVGGFMIFNTFSITIAQRTREFAMLRTLGASRRQILRSVLLEALVIGLLASVAGLLLGLGLAPGLSALFDAFGLDLPGEGTVVAARTIIVALVAGTLMTVLASIVPAVRATRVPPMAALREGAVLPPGRAARFRVPAAVVLGVLGLGLGLYGLLGGLDGGEAAGLVGAGAGTIFLSAALLSPNLVPPLAAAVGRPLARVRGVTGRLAYENAVRNPGRTAATAAALMVGLALVAFVTIFAAGARESIARNVDEGLAGDFVVQHDNGFSPIPSAAADALRRVPGMGDVSELRFVQTRVQGKKDKRQLTGIDPQSFLGVYRLKFDEGTDATLRDLAGDEVLVRKQIKDDVGAEVGGDVTLVAPNGRPVRFRVAGIYDDKAGLLGGFVTSNETVGRDFGVRQNQVILAAVREGADPAAVQRRANRVLEREFPSVELFTEQEFVDDQSDQINQILGLFYILLSLSVIVSLFGIVNTLALSIHERTRELGLLRAIGTSRGQVRRIIRYEAVITSLIGAVLGLVLGALFAVLVTLPLVDEGFTISFPVGTLIGLLVLAALAGVVAAISPARRAARLDVLEALAYE